MTNAQAQFMTVEELVRSWFEQHGNTRREGSELYQIAAAVEVDINRLSNVELLSHVSDALEVKLTHLLSDISSGLEERRK